MKNILITGVSTGIGLGATREFCKKGYRVFGSVRKPEDAEQLKNESDENFVPLIFDVTDEKAILDSVTLVEKIVGQNGLSGLINNAGIAVSGPLMHIPIEELQEQFNVNVFGIIRVTQAFLPLLGAQKNCPHPPGRILNISSVAGKVAFPFLGSYVGSKHAVEGLSHSMRRELQLYGIDVIIVGPGAVNSAIWDKDSAQNIPEYYLETDFVASATKFQKQFVKQGKRGFPIDYFGKRLVQIFEKNKPKTRYALVPKKFREWTLLRLIPDRKLDRMIAKGLGLVHNK
ncbi:SDR family oxidoreductase [Xanthovirga aplysinae]|uniref:SDR family oxidoreductase n=1 Tax=Xanthovirga aplysinae TaxID=2529853 RepID=UPI0012BBFAE6|nr:SDR family oxidoreductase [Xanthovirga aplysinae]MTI33491.1 SDR family oxidoreductase [Xanthovirga aplysinae]